MVNFETVTVETDLLICGGGMAACGAAVEACYWANCQEGLDEGSRVDWDGVAGLSSGDAVIYGEGTFGHGPEVLLTENPFVATYTVGVYFWPPSNLPAADATVEIFSGGTMRFSRTRTMQPDQFWEGGDVVIASDSLTVVEKSLLCAPGDWICTDPVDDCPQAN